MAMREIPIVSVPEILGHFPLNQEGFRMLEVKIKRNRYILDDLDLAITDFQDLSNNLAYRYDDMVALIDEWNEMETRNFFDHKDGMWIYMLTDHVVKHGKKRYKVGKTERNTLKRCLELRTGNVDLEVARAWLVKTRSSAKLERVETMCHRALDAWKIEGIGFSEWFSCAEYEVLYAIRHSLQVSDCNCEEWADIKMSVYPNHYPQTHGQQYQHCL